MEDISLHYAMILANKILYDINVSFYSQLL